MNIDALTTAPQPIPVHAVFALAAIFLGGVQFALPKGTAFHRALGYIWVTTMVLVAGTSFFINEFRWIGPFGPIHLLSAFVFLSVWQAIRSARHRDIEAHRRGMRQLYVLSLLVAGAFTLLPGRIMHQVFFL
ncbi:MAG: DUF2306 domain-containing protein [Pseudomonadota bacterium]